MKKNLILLILLLPFLILGCSESEKTTLICDMETISGTNYTQATFGKSHTQSDQNARSGKYSAAVNKENQFALDHKIQNVKKGSNISISIWRKSSNEYGALTLTTDENKILVQTSKPTKKENGWDLLEINYFAEKDFKYLFMYVYNPYEEFVFFDDLEYTIVQ